MNSTPIRWGFLSTADIGRKNWKAIYNSGNSIVIAVASRDILRSQRFIEECQADTPFPTKPLALGSYSELLENSDIDAVYIPLPTGVRKEWVIKAAKAKKHVICEKPCAVNLSDLIEMTDACKMNGVQFMDGVMHSHGHRLTTMRTVLDDPLDSIGTIQRVQVSFSFAAPLSFFQENIRAVSSLEPQGCLGDLGWYCIRFTLWALKWKLPSKVIGRILTETSSHVPTAFSGELLYPNGLSAGFYCSFTSSMQQWAVISGSKGYLHINDFVVPYRASELNFSVCQGAFQPSGCELKVTPNFTSYTVKEHSDGHPDAQESNMFRNFSVQILKGSVQLNTDWPMYSLKTQQVMDAVLESARSGCVIIDVIE